MAENLAELCCSSVLRKENLQGMKLDKLAEEIWKETAEGVAWFFLTAYSEMREERWTEVGITKQKGAQIWKILSLSILAQKWMASESTYRREYYIYAWTITQRRIHGTVPEQTLAAWMEDAQTKWREAVDRTTGLSKRVCFFKKRKK